MYDLFELNVKFGAMEAEIRRLGDLTYENQTTIKK